MRFAPRRGYRVGAGLALVLSLLPSTAVHAQSLDDKRSQARALAAKLDQQAREIVAHDRLMRQARAELQTAETAVDQAEADLAEVTASHEAARRRLAVHAQDSYVLGGSSSIVDYLGSETLDDAVVRRTYLRLVTGEDREAIGTLRATEEDLEDQHRALENARDVARDEAEAVEGQNESLRDAIAKQRAVLAQVDAELSQLLAAERARQAAAAAAKPRAAAGGPQSVPVAQLPGTVADVFACIRQLESGNNYGTPGGGAYQFLDSTWQGLGYEGTASDAPPALQDEAAMKLYNQAGFQPWTTAPLCGQP